MTVSIDTPSRTLEERLQPWLNQAEYLIILTIVIMLWAAGWVDLLGFKSDTNAPIFGRYSIPYFALLVVYTLGFVFWGWLIVSLRALERFKRFIAFFQRQPLLFAASWLVFGAVMWTMLGGNLWRYNLTRVWVRFRLLEVALLILILLFTAVVLLAKPMPNAPFQRWRKVVLLLVGLVIAGEAILQGATYLRLLPVDNVTGITVPHGRIYQQTEGYANGFTNSYGWYYPEFRLKPETQRIVLTGDTFVEALQIPVKSHMGVRLDTLINANTPPVETEVIAQGQWGYGPTTFMFWRMYDYIWRPLAPDEIVVFFHLANDFQVLTGDAERLPLVAIDENGAPLIVPEEFNYWHRLADRVVQGHSASDPMRTVVSQSMLLNTLFPNAINDYLRLSLYHPEFISNIDQVTDAEPFGPATFLFQTGPGADAENSFAVAAAQIREFRDYLADEGVRMRLITIPYFPAGYYADNAGGAASSVWDEYDVLQPERQLEAAAQAVGVPFLGMGEFMLNDLTTPEIQALYFKEGTGHLTEQGHEYFAQAVYHCFYNASRPLDGQDVGCAAGDES